MFIYTNPPKHSKKGRKKAGAKGGAKKRHKKFKKFSVFTPGGGRLLAANRGKSLKGLLNNPRKSISWSSILQRHLRHRSAAQSRSTPIMAKRHGRGRHVRYNGSSVFASPRQKGLFGNFFKNMVGVTPILAGVVANGLATSFASRHIPYTKSGIGNILLGIGTASGLGLATSKLSKNSNLGNGVMVGGIVGTLGCWFQNMMMHGIVESLKPGMGNWADDRLSNWSADRLNGMGDFTTPGGITNAFQGNDNMSAYSLPSTTAQFMPQAQIALPHQPAMAQGAKSMAAYEAEALGAVLGNETNMGL